MKKSFLLFCLFIGLSGYSQSISIEGASWDDLQDEYITLRLDALVDNKGFMAYVMFGEAQYTLLSHNSTDYAEFKFETNALSLMATKGYHFVHRYQANKYSVYIILKKEDYK